MDRKPNGYYTILVSGALVRLHQAGYCNPRVAEVFLLLNRIGLVEETDQNAKAACAIALNSDVVRELARMLADRAD